MAVPLAPTTRNILLPRLLRLPLELRNQIYHYLIPEKRVIEVSDPRFNYRISYKRTIGAEIVGFDSEEDISDYDESCVEQGTQILPEIAMPDDNLSISEMENNDSVSGLLEDTHIKSIVDFGGCTNSTYEVAWDYITTSLGYRQKKERYFHGVQTNFQ